MSLFQETERTHRNILAMLHASDGIQTLPEQYSVFKPLVMEVLDAMQQLGKPLRVACVGYMKAGKSTLINALLNRRIVMTGALVTTYTPTWFRYAEKESMSLLFKDGSQQDAPLAELEKWTSITAIKSNPRIRDVKCVILWLNSEILKYMELIDSPGLFSPEDDDSQRAMDLMGIQDAEETHKVNDYAIAGADAVIYAFSMTFRKDDLRVVSAFTSTPINAIGVFTRIDSYWQPTDAENMPIAITETAVKQMQAELQDRLFCLKPVYVLCCEGMIGLEDDLWNMLCALSEMRAEDLADSLISVKLFIMSAGNEVEKDLRRKAIARFGQCGVYAIARAIQQGISREDMTEYLKDQCGLNDISKVLISHFGTRSALIKSQSSLARMYRCLDAVTFSASTSKRDLIIADSIRQELDSISRHSAFAQLRLLQSYYEGKLRFPTPEDNASFLALTGEAGFDVSARLGLPENASIPELCQGARESVKRWTSIMNDFTCPRNVKQASETMWIVANDLLGHLIELSSV